MKKILLLAFFALSTGIQAFAQEDAIQRFFSKYMEDERFSRVYISPKMMQMAGGFLKNNGEGDKDAEQLGTLIGKIKGIRILSTEVINGKALYSEAMGTLSRNKYEELMDIQDKGGSLKFMIREEAGLIRELTMISGNSTSFSLISMLGSFTYEDLNMLADKTNIPGMEQYSKGSKGTKGTNK
ncbi:MAG: DUF4252 domain-containing protein [Algoriphagus sp.]|jgi:hypothetical protein|uniref:DUF4252 domain-containing protein n=1 Tax=Algoriphagus sp. TaxID=1872435 RepID=UPI0027574E69|nr:DUF4252 domain-containing protein [Algoriphagus sp.]MDP4748468.1 DUF4252 domain-containing protein [Algoriphagus sp.]MDP4838840.1 DUF4252 domain-containing protein [Algoriphagus sp.]MDP4903614.1 DUF4252 domain-containing protein [Algoriphagus sp.]MDP4956298.1 DUF4252 domain-containing protein [Algoriphagus sp.]